MIVEPTILPEGTKGEVPLAKRLTLWEVTVLIQDEVQADPIRPTGETLTFYVADTTKWKAQLQVRGHLRERGIYTQFPKVKKVPPLLHTVLGAR